MRKTELLISFILILIIGTTALMAVKMTSNDDSLRQNSYMVETVPAVPSASVDEVATSSTEEPFPVSEKIKDAEKSVVVIEEDLPNDDGLVTENREVNSIVEGIQDPKEELDPVACTMDAKQCPDGSYVGREAPNCEFQKCPDEVILKAM